MTIGETSRWSGEEAAGAFIPRGRRWGNAALGGHLIDRLREALGWSHYERMRRGMGPDLAIPYWFELSEGAREAYRQRLDYVMPALLDALDVELRELRDELTEELLDEERI